MAILWTQENAPESLLGALENLCAIDGGSVQNNEEAGGTYTVVCQTGASGTLTANSMTAAVPAALARASRSERRSDLESLHPVVRRKVKAVQKQLDDENIPMKVFETFRSPQRQAALYAQGRTAPGSRVTNAYAWESYHQYGVAADFVRFENGSWNWRTDTQERRAQWDRFHEIAISEGLEPLSWEKPHVQLAGYSHTQLMNGDYPQGGDASWAAALSEAISSWPDAGTPPYPDDQIRPAMASATMAVTPSGNASWHSLFGGDEWAYDQGGLYTKRANGNLKVWRTPGAPVTVQEVLGQLDAPITRASAKYGVSKELIVMTIATETGALRRVGFTGPDSFRWEQGYTVNATGDDTLDGREKGDYSAGPMQVLSDTARWMNNEYDLGYDNATDFTFFKNKPNPKTEHIGLFDVERCIDVGTAYIRHNMTRTGDDPLLVAAAYNAGGLYPSSANHWRIRSYGNHLDRAAEWYGDACFVLNG